MTINPTIPTVGSPRGSEEVDVANALTAIVDAVNKGTGPAVVASLPIAPVDGQEVYFVADAVAGVVWHLKYRAASPSAYKWEYVGGRSLAADVAAEQATTSLAYVDLATVGPSATVPLAGDYDIDFGAAIYSIQINTNASLSFAVGAVAAIDADRILQGQGSSGTNALASHNRDVRKTTVAAASAIVLKYKTSAGEARFSNRWLRVTPVRVG